WQGSNYSQSGCTKLNKDEWGDEAQYTNSRDGIKMGPFIDNLYKYKYDFANGQSSDYQRIDYAQLIQENTDRVYMFEAKQDDPNTYKITFDTRIADPKSTNVHNPYYAAGYHSYENRTTVNYMQWGGLRFKPELSITVNGKKNNILVDPQTHNDYVEVHEGEKTKISLNSKNDKQGLAMWSTGYKSTSALSWQLGKADENLFNADYKETPVDVDNNAANPYVHQNARMELSGVVIAKPGSEMNIAWAGSGMPNFTDEDITSVYGDKTQMDDGLNAFLPNREIRSVNVRVIPAAAYAQKTKIAIRFKGQNIVLSEQEKQNIKKTIYDANKDHYDIKNGENGITVDNSGNVSFTIQFNAAKHKGDRANMQYRTLKLKPADTLSYTTIDIKPVDGSASFSLNSKNGAIDPTLTVYNHEPYQVKVNATDTTSKMNDFLTNGGTNVTGLSTDHQEYQKNHRGMQVDDKTPYVLTMNGQGLLKDGKTYKIKFESWDGNDTKTVSQEVKVVVADQAGRYQNKVKGRTWTVEVNDKTADHLKPENFVDDSTKAMLGKAPSGVAGKTGVTYTFKNGVPAHDHVTKGNTPKDVTVVAKFTDNSTLEIKGKLIVNDTQAPIVEFDTTDHKVANEGNNTYQLNVYSNEKFDVAIKAHDNSNIVQDLRAKQGNTLPQWISSDEDQVQTKYKSDTKGQRNSKGTSNNPYIIHITGTVPNNIVNQEYSIPATAWDDVDNTGTAKLYIKVLPQCDKYKNLLQGKTQTIEVKEAIPDIKSFVTAKGVKLPDSVKYAYEGTGFDNTNIKEQNAVIKLTFADKSYIDVKAKLNVQDTHLATVQFASTDAHVKVSDKNYIQSTAPSDTKQSSVTITAYVNEQFGVNVNANDNSGHIQDVLLSKDNGSLTWMTANDRDYQQHNRNKAVSESHPYQIQLTGTPTTKGTSTAVIKTWDGANHEGDIKFTINVLDQAAQFDGQTLTGQTQTVTLHTKINQNEVERYVSDATKSLLKKANGNVTYSFKDMKELSTDAVSADGKQVHVIATFSDKSTKEIIGTLIVNDKNAPTVNFVKGTNSGPVQIDNQSKTITVYRNENFNINANVKDDSKVVNDAKLTSKDTATHNEFTITTDHDSNHNHGHDPYVLNIRGSFGTQAKLGSYSRTIHAVDGNNNTGDTNFKFVVKDQASQFDGDQLSGATKTVEVNSGYTPKAEDFIDKATKQKLDAANGTENYAFAKQPTIDKVKTETVPITVTFSDGSHKVINGTLKVQDTTVPSLKLIKTNSNKKNRVGEITCTPSDSKHKNSTATVVVYRNEQFSIQALATDNSNIINDARFHGSAADITDNHDVYQAQYRGKKGKVNDPYVVTIEGGFSKDLKFDPNTHTKTIDGSYVRAWDGVDNTNDLKIKFIVKDQSAQFDNDKLNGITKIVEINSANIPQAQDFIDPATLKKLSSAKDGIICTFVGDKAPKIDTVKTNEKVDVVVTFSDKSTKTIYGHLTVKDTTAPVITVSKDEKGKCVVNGDQITVYNNEPFNLNVSAVDNSNHVSNITIEGTHEGVSLASDHKGEGSKAKPYTSVISGTFNDKGTHTITLNATDASHNKGTKKLTVVVKGQDAQFDNQTFTGITKTVEVNDDSVSLKPEDFVSQDTKDLLGKATKGVQWTFVDNKELDKSKVTSANTGKEVHIKAEFADKTSKTIVGHLIVQDTKAPTLELVSSDPKSKDIVVTKGSDNSYNITVYRGREFKLLAKATDNSHVVTDVNIAGGDINGFSNDHDAYIKNLAKNPKGTSKDPYVLTMTGTFANDFSTGLYTRTVTAKDASGHSTT
ncbi:MAG: Rib/alpha-like domain-containing protein, partial [Lactobacillus iners]|nr:Rib/alpha-like domain-containing protein [Lactobacillus iners]